MEHYTIQAVILLTTEARKKFLNQYRDCHEALDRFCLALCHDREAARELVQECLLQALQGYHRLQDEGKFLSWLMGIAIRVKKNHERKWRKLVPMEQLPEKESAEQSDADAALSVLRHLCRRLKETERECFLLFELSGLPIEAIAEAQESNPNTVKTRLRRARGKLKKWLEKEYGPQDPPFTGTNLSLSMEDKDHG